MQQATYKNFTYWFDNPAETKGLFEEIFKLHNYYFETEEASPVIIDAGAHIGLSTLYFKLIYPQSRIVAIEPHPDLFQLLQRNVEENHLEDVKLIQAALADKSGEITLFMDSSADKWYSTSGVYPGAWDKKQTSNSYTTEAILLADILDKPVDLLKMDIEGMEQRVLLACGAAIRKAKHIILEYHPVRNTNRLDVIKKFFKAQGFEPGLVQKQKTSRGDLLLLEYIRK